MFYRVVSRKKFSWLHSASAFRTLSVFMSAHVIHLLASMQVSSRFARISFLWLLQQSFLGKLGLSNPFSISNTHTKPHKIIRVLDFLKAFLLDTFLSN